MDPGSTLFAKMTFEITKQMTVVVIGSLRVKTGPNGSVECLPSDQDIVGWIPSLVI